jgi:hypothetical protein
MKTDSQRIVADGFRRLRKTGAYEDERTRLIAEARRRRGDELACASLWQRISVNWEIEREVRAKLAKRFPREALYAARVRF